MVSKIDLKLHKMNVVKILFLMLSFKLLVFGIHNYNLYEVTAFNDIERALLYSMHMKEGNIIFLNSVTSEATIPMNVIVIDKKVNFFEKKLNKLYIEYTLKETKSEYAIYYIRITLRCAICRFKILFFVLL